MILFVRAALFVAGMFFLIIGASFLLDPAQAAAGFGMGADSTQGLSSIRADMTAFFWVGGGGLLWGAWARNSDPLLMAAALFAVAFVGRLVNLMQHGTYDGWWFAMAIEAVTTALALLASRVLPHRGL